MAPALPTRQLCVWKAGMKKRPETFAIPISAKILDIPG
jgi:hypothetical protein